jgi:signal transduction histidine kinase
MTIRLRLTIWYGFAIAVTVALVAVIVWFQFSSDLRSSVEEALAVQVADVSAAIDTGSPEPALSEDPARPGIFTLVLDRYNNIVERSRNAPSIGPVPLGGSTSRSGGAADIAVWAAKTSNGRTVIAGSSLAGIDEELRRLAGLLVLVGGVAAAASLAGGWWLARRALAPVSVLVDEADMIHDATPTLGRRLHTPNTDDELGRLAATLNRMLSRVDRSLQRQRTIVAAASHDLRTPIAALRIELELALRTEATNEQLRTAIEDALGDVGRLGRLADDLLDLAAIEDSGRPVSAEPVDLAPLVAEIAGRATAARPESAVELDLEVDDGTLVTDRVRLEQALSNLVTNAVRHSPPGGAVTVRARRSADTDLAEGGQQILEVDVLDRGPGIEPTRIGMLFVPFARRPDRGEGAGLGLAVADAAVRALGGRIGYRERPGGGAWFWFRVPTSQAT